MTNSYSMRKIPVVHKNVQDSLIESDIDKIKIFEMD